MEEIDGVEEVRKIEKVFSVSVSSDTLGAVASAIENGRVKIEGDEIEITLLSPVDLENGEKVTKIKVCEPTVDQLAKATKVAGDVEVASRLIASISDEPLGVIKRLKQRDFILLSHILNFFC